MPFNDEEISKLGAINLLGPDVATIGKAASEGSENVCWAMNDDLA